ncbi:hypothetical protein LCGC14_2657630 [marine sediment metagenome]|uniref:Uncharacterized protein n=1 Tax=marine sediment metagenome TaxID=412755 RepID=A0A0F8ZT19_9ZZZZ
MLSELKRLAFQFSVGFTPLCGCGARVTQLRHVTSMGHVIGLLFSCDEHVVIVDHDHILVVAIEDGKDVAEAEVCSAS